MQIKHYNKAKKLTIMNGTALYISPEITKRRKDRTNKFNIIIDIAEQIRYNESYANITE